METNTSDPAQYLEWSKTIDVLDYLCDNDFGNFHICLYPAGRELLKASVQTVRGVFYREPKSYDTSFKISYNLTYDTVLNWITQCYKSDSKAMDIMMEICGPSISAVPLEILT